MITGQVIANLSRNIENFMKLENMMSTGRKINKPSDDPIGTISSLGYRSKLAQFEQFTKNISSAKTWLSHEDLALSDMNGLLIQAKEIAVTLANDSYDYTARQGAASEIESIFEQVLQAGNTQLDNRYIFSGHKTLQQAFRSTGVGVIYEGDDGVIKTEIENGATVGINTVGSSVLTKSFTVIGDDADLKAGIDGATLLTQLNAGDGIDLTTGTFNITDANLNTTVTVDISAAVTINDVITEINTQLAAGGITNLTASIGLEGNNISFTATDRPDVTVDTPLANVNSGAGVSLSPGTFEIHNSDHSTSVVIDISSGSNLGDVITSINSQLTAAGIANVTASLNAAGTGLQIQDTNGVPLGLSVSNLGEQNTTATELGLVGDISPTLVGTDLQPQPEFVIEESAVDETVAAGLGILGTMNYDLIGEDLDSQITGDTALSLLNNGVGFELDSIRISQGDSTVTVDLGASTLVTVQDLIDTLNATGLSITAAINSTGKGISITNDDQTMTLVVKDIEESKPARMLGIAGSPDVMGNLLVLADALRENDREVVNSVIEGLDSSLDAILNNRASAGAKMIRLESTELRLTEYNLSFTKLLSDTEDADLTKLVADLAQQENTYTAALQAAAKIIQPSLLDFLG